jgi:hypothetical protein
MSNFRSWVVSARNIYTIPPSQKSSDPLLATPQSEDGSLKEGNTLTRWGNLIRDAMVASGRPAPTEELLRERLEKAGFVDVQSFTLLQPMGPWAKDKYEPWVAIDHNLKTPRTHNGV